MYSSIRKLGQGIVGVVDKQTCLKECKRGFMFSFSKIITQDKILKFFQPIDLTLDGITKWVEDKEWEYLKNSHKYDAVKARMVGSDIMAANFIVAKGGKVKFLNRDTWFKKGPDNKMDCPIPSSSESKLEAIDASGTTLMAVSMDYLYNLNHLKYLNLSNCKYIDDWSLDKLSSQTQNTLTVLDLSGCPNISERGLACLHRVKGLRKIILRDMRGVDHPKLIAFLLEEALPECIIEGIDYTDLAQELEDSKDPALSLISSWESVAKKHQNEVTNALMNNFEADFDRYSDKLNMK